MKKLRIGLATAAAATLLVGGIATATNHPQTDKKVALCHKTSSEQNPWVVQEVNANEVASHLANGDKYYTGSFNIHSDQAKLWCKPTESPSPTPTPEVTPASSPSPTPEVTPSPTPTPTVSTSTSVVTTKPLTLPAAGGTGKRRP